MRVGYHVLLGVAVLAGCVRATEPLEPADDGFLDAEPAPPARQKPAQRERWAPFEASRGWPVVQRYDAQGHAVRGMARVRVDARLAAALAGDPAAPLRGVAVQTVRRPDDAIVGHYVMMRLDAAPWTYLALGPDGRRWDIDVSRCASCHGQARGDDLFRLKRRSPAASTK